MKTNKETAEILNDLVQINNDRIEGYEKAAKELVTGDQDLKSIFLSMIDESRTYKMALSSELNVLGTATASDTTTSGKIYRTWMDVKSIFAGHSRKAVLENCEVGEAAAQTAYIMACEEEDLPAHIKTLLLEQKASLMPSLNKIKSLRDLES